MGAPESPVRQDALAQAIALAKLALVAETHLHADEVAHAEHRADQVATRAEITSARDEIAEVKAAVVQITARLETMHAEDAPTRQFVSGFVAAAGKKAGGVAPVDGEEDAAREAFLAAVWRRLNDLVAEPPWMVKKAAESLLTVALVALTIWLAMRFGIAFTPPVVSPVLSPQVTTPDPTGPARLPPTEPNDGHGPTP